MKTWAIVLAAGSGSRFGFAKQFALLGSRRLVDHAVATAAEVCDDVVLVIPPDTRWDGAPVAKVVEGGATRAESVRAGLAAVPAEAEIVAIHDAAHPLASEALMRSVLEAVCDGADAATPALAATETQGRLAADGSLSEVSPRSRLTSLQMPHAFRASVLRAAHDRGLDATDDVSMLVSLGHRVAAVPGEVTNVHVTTSAELAFAQAVAGVPRWSARLDGRTVLVTGATGLIGTHLLPLLNDLGATVHASSRRPRVGENAFWHVTDLTSPGAAELLLDASQADLVVHLAGEVVGARSLDAVLPTLDGNLAATVRLLEAAARRQCHRVVIAGSMYQEPFQHTDPVPAAPYGASKYALRGYVRMFQETFGLDVVTLRPTMAYGPAQSDHSKVVPYAALSLLRGETPELSSGTWEIDWVYASDVARAFTLALVAPDAPGATLDVGSGQVASVRSVVEQVDRRVAGITHPVFGARSDRPNELTPDVDLERTWRVLGWHAQVGLDEGISRTVEWFRSSLEPEPK